MKIRPQAMNEEDAVESPAVMLHDLQAFRQTALQAVDTAIAKILAKEETMLGRDGIARRSLLCIKACSTLSCCFVTYIAEIFRVSCLSIVASCSCVCVFIWSQRILRLSVLNSSCIQMSFRLGLHLVVYVTQVFECANHCHYDALDR